MAWLLIVGRREHVLRQLLQHHLPTDSRRLARALIEASNQYPPFWELALDMMHRLGHHDLIIQALLDRQELLAALHVIHHHPQYFLSDTGVVRSEAGLHDESILVTGQDLFDCALEESYARAGSPEPFFALHSFFMSISPRTITAIGSKPSPLALEIADLEERLRDVVGSEQSQVLARALGVC